MIITDLDSPLTAEEARKLAMNNREDSADRYCFRELMQNVKYASSFGYTRYQSMCHVIERMPSEYVQNVLKSMGYKITVKRAYKWDDEKKTWSDKPYLDSSGREQWFVELTWG